MANECRVYQFAAVRDKNTPVPPMPPLVYSTLSTTGSVTLNKSTTVVGICTSLAGTVDFSTIANVDPDGTKSPVPVQANVDMVCFSVRPGSKVRFD